MQVGRIEYINHIIVQTNHKSKTAHPNEKARTVLLPKRCTIQSFRVRSKPPISVPESVGKFPVTIVRHGKIDSSVSVR